MHGVERSPEPDYFDAIRCRYNGWDELYGTAGEEVRSCRGRQPAPCCAAYLHGLDGDGIRQEVRNALRTDFSGICGYCEQDCTSMVTVIEHFRPRSMFPDEWITWVNLVYACERCDYQKSDKWPGDAGSSDIAYSYINPSLVPDQHPAEGFFEYYTGIANPTGFTGDNDDLIPGQIMPSTSLPAGDWWKADRTIVDLDLNSDANYSVSGDERLPHLRNVYLETLIMQIESDFGDLYSNIDLTRDIFRELSQPGQPFSSYVAAFARSLSVQVR